MGNAVVWSRCWYVAVVFCTHVSEVAKKGSCVVQTCGPRPDKFGFGRLAPSVK